MGRYQNQPKKIITHSDSQSLWNYTLSPGWKQDEVKILKQALTKFGIGKWKKIIESQCLPGKSIGLLGQQSLGDFMGLKVQLEKVFLDNMKKTNAVRKNNCIINMGDNPNKEERVKRIKLNKEKYGVSHEESKLIKLPRIVSNSNLRFFDIEDIENDKLTTLEKIIHLYELQGEVRKKIKRIESGQSGIEYDSDSVEEKFIMIDLKILGNGKYLILN